MDLPTATGIADAARRIAPHAVATPLIESAALNARVGTRVFLKLETLQRTGSFKFRGALNRLAMLDAAARGRGVVAFSSGNHAQGVAAAAALFGAPALIVMPKDAPRTKLEGTRALGAEVAFYDRHRDDREAIAAGLAAARGATLIRPFDDAGIVAGQGTVGLEIARQVPVPLSALLAPCSGGGLVSGIALALAGAGAATRVHSVEVEGFDGMRRSLDAGRRVAAPGGAPSIADALMAPMPGEIPFALAARHLAGGLTVGDAAIRAAMVFALQTLKLVVEPGGAAALAALLSGTFRPQGPVAAVLSGGNCDPALLVRLLAP